MEHAIFGLIAHLDGHNAELILKHPPINEYRCLRCGLTNSLSCRSAVLGWSVVGSQAGIDLDRPCQT